MLIQLQWNKWEIIFAYIWDMYWKSANFCVWGREGRSRVWKGVILSEGGKGGPGWVVRSQITLLEGKKGDPIVSVFEGRKGDHRVSVFEGEQGDPRDTRAGGGTGDTRVNLFPSRYVLKITVIFINRQHVKFKNKETKIYLLFRHQN